MTLVHENVGS